jgi:hypothetical protein
MLFDLKFISTLLILAVPPDLPDENAERRKRGQH